MVLAKGDRSEDIRFCPCAGGLVQGLVVAPGLRHDVVEERGVDFRPHPGALAAALLPGLARAAATEPEPVPPVLEGPVLLLVHHVREAPADADVVELVDVLPVNVARGDGGRAAQCDPQGAELV